MECGNLFKELFLNIIYLKNKGLKKKKIRISNLLNLKNELNLLYVLEKL